ncbi:WGR domain-containing protein [Spartinivicinus poritis]|uniref:WGR domain-containing protein n=1 Tax=Spartinivicinus poritis TaxID=2994640 RepID=A0ABT5UH24_9GAMM|nr:WGR domain-containing protein [Spartinivicinus sp. A2-2]MDE1465510.1 WGR domain-containing protein [Spartinivicinus sp. A2-2]
MSATFFCLLNYQLIHSRVIRMIHLKLSDEKSHKFYTLLIQQDLFGKWSLLRQWDKIGTKGQVQIDTFDSYEEARVVQAKLVKEKRRKGYSGV